MWDLKELDSRTEENGGFLGLGWEWERLAMGTNLWLQTSKFWVQRTARWLQLQYCMET